MKHKKTNIEVEKFKDPFTIFSSGFAIIMPSESDDTNEDSRSPRFIKWGIFKDKKQSYKKSETS